MAVNKQKVAKKRATVGKAPARGKKPSTGKKTAAVKSSPGPATGKTRAAGDKPATASTQHPPLIRVLLAEHRHIATVMQLFSDQLTAIEAGELVDTHVVYEIMDYMVTWPDRFHHPREDLIYGRVAELDAAAAENVDSLQRDHDHTAETGRQVLRDIQQWRDGEISGELLVKSGRAYVAHMYEHMNSEEQLVFPQIERVLGAGDWRDLALDDRLQPVGDPVFGPRVQREFRNLARKLRSKVRQGVERGTLVEWLSVGAFMESLEVVSMAYESSRGSADEHVRIALDEGKELLRESLVTAPWRLAGNNVRLGLRLVQEVAEISREALDDIARINRERKDWIRLMDN